MADTKVYTVLRQWHTTEEEYHSASQDITGYDSAFITFHDWVKLLINDTNVSQFKLTFMDDYGAQKSNPIVWQRQTEEPEESETAE